MLAVAVMACCSTSVSGAGPAARDLRMEHSLTVVGKSVSQKPRLCYLFGSVISQEGGGLPRTANSTL